MSFSRALVCLALGLTLGGGGLVACGGRSQSVRKSARELGNAIEKGEEKEVHAHLLPMYRTRIDGASMLQNEALAHSLAQPTEVRMEATIHLGEDDVVDLRQEEDGGWYFAGDPTRYYGQSTPREALRSFVRATRNARWDVVLELAPTRFRRGLSEEELAKAWTISDDASFLRKRRDQLAAHLADPIREDAHQATLSLRDGSYARLERERMRWVIVDF